MTAPNVGEFSKQSIKWFVPSENYLKMAKVRVYFLTFTEEYRFFPDGFHDLNWWNLLIWKAWLILTSCAFLIFSGVPESEGNLVIVS